MSQLSVINKQTKIKNQKKFTNKTYKKAYEDRDILSKSKL